MKDDKTKVEFNPDFKVVKLDLKTVKKSFEKRVFFKEDDNKKTTDISNDDVEYDSKN